MVLAKWRTLDWCSITIGGRRFHQRAPPVFAASNLE